MKTIIVLVMMFTASFANADDLQCRPNGEGWALANITKNFFFGPRGSFYFSKAVCESVRSTLVIHSNGFGIVCAQNPSGTSVYTLDGQIVGDGSYYYKSSNCVDAMRAMSDWVLCVPHKPGSALFDLKLGNRVSAYGYYHTVSACNWAAASASSDDAYVCGPTNGGSVIFDRNTNRRVNSRKFATTEQCYKSLREAY